MEMHFVSVPFGVMAVLGVSSVLSIVSAAVDSTFFAESLVG
jgi:hypothetical protein